MIAAAVVVVLAAVGVVCLASKGFFKQHPGSHGVWDARAGDVAPAARAPRQTVSGGWPRPRGQAKAARTAAADTLPPGHFVICDELDAWANGEASAPGEAGQPPLAAPPWEGIPAEIVPEPPLPPLPDPDPLPGLLHVCPDVPAAAVYPADTVTDMKPVPDGIAMREFVIKIMHGPSPARSGLGSWVDDVLAVPLPADEPLLGPLDWWVDQVLAAPLPAGAPLFGPLDWSLAQLLPCEAGDG